MPNAFPRSDGSVKIVESSARADGASTAPNTPCAARAPTSTPKDSAAPPTAEAIAKPSRPPMNAHLRPRSEEHTSELQSRQYLVCRLLLEKKKKILITSHPQ